MIVRGWVMVGPHDSGSELPQEMYAGQWVGQPPRATDFQVGQWLIWQYAQFIHAQMILVCVDIPLLRPGDTSLEPTLMMIRDPHPKEQL